MIKTANYRRWRRGGYVTAGGAGVGLGYVCGQWGMQRASGAWEITHLPTGFLGAVAAEPDRLVRAAVVLDRALAVRPRRSKVMHRVWLLRVTTTLNRLGIGRAPRDRYFHGRGGRDLRWTDGYRALELRP